MVERFVPMNRQGTAPGNGPSAKPIMAADGRPQIDFSTLSRLFARARQFHDVVRVLPQTHKVLGIQ